MIDQFNDHSANERTFLAWVRTAMALVGFGLVVAHLRDKPVGDVAQVALIVIGGLVVVMAYVRMRVFMRRIDDRRTYAYATEQHGIMYLAAVLSLFILSAVFLWTII